MWDLVCMHRTCSFVPQVLLVWWTMRHSLTCQCMPCDKNTLAGFKWHWELELWIHQTQHSFVEIEILRFPIENIQNLQSSSKMSIFLNSIHEKSSKKISMSSARPTWCPHHRLIQVHQQRSMFPPSLPLKSYHFQPEMHHLKQPLIFRGKSGCAFWGRVSFLRPKKTIAEEIEKKWKSTPWKRRVELSPFLGCHRHHQDFFNVFRLGDPYIDLHLPQLTGKLGRQPNLTCKKSIFFTETWLLKAVFSMWEWKTSCCWRLNQVLMFFPWIAFPFFLQSAELSRLVKVLHVGCFNERTYQSAQHHLWVEKNLAWGNKNKSHNMFFWFQIFLMKVACRRSAPVKSASSNI